LNANSKKVFLESTVTSIVRERLAAGVGPAFAGTLPGVTKSVYRPGVDAQSLARKASLRGSLRCGRRYSLKRQCK
jgi:hypothetical protein